MAKKNVKYVISLEDKMSSTLNRVDKKTHSFEKSIKRIGGVLTGVFAGRAIIQGLTKTTSLFDKQAQAIAQVEAGLQSTNNVAGRTLEDLTKQASKFQEKTIFGDEEILKGVTAQLLTFTNITKTQFDRTQQAALDLSSRLGGDLQASTIQLGKALNDPIANLGALGRSGIQFSEKQKTVIKSLAKTNRLAEAQDIILTELEKQYGGSAEAARKAGTGGYKALKNTFGDLQEVIGKRLLKSTPNLARNLNRITKSAIRFVDVNVADELEDQRNELNRLVIEINDSNKSESQRLAILDRIKEISPDIAKGIKKEGDNYKVSTEALNKFNLEQLNRIVLAEKQEKLDKLRRKQEEYGAKAVKQATLIRERQAGAIFKLSKVNKKDAELVQAMLDGTITRETDLAEIREKYGEENMLLLNQAGFQVARNEKEFINAQNIAIKRIIRRNNLSEKSLGLDKEFYDAVRRFNPLFNAQNAASLKANQLLKERARLAGAFGITSVAPSPELLDSVTTLKSAAPKTFNININSLIEEFNINNIENIQEGAVEMKNIVSRELEKALADLQAIAK